MPCEAILEPVVRPELIHPLWFTAHECSHLTVSVTFDGFLLQAHFIRCLREKVSDFRNTLTIPLNLLSLTQAITHADYREKVDSTKQHHVMGSKQPQHPPNPPDHIIFKNVTYLSIQLQYLILGLETHVF